MNNFAFKVIGGRDVTEETTEASLIGSAVDHLRNNEGVQENARILLRRDLNDDEIQKTGTELSKGLVGLFMSASPVSAHKVPTNLTIQGVPGSGKTEYLNEYYNSLPPAVRSQHIRFA